MIWVFFAAIAVAVVYLPLTGQGAGAARSIVKTLPVALFALIAALGGPLPLAAGLALSALGDTALSRTGEKAFLTGLSAFALAHLAYLWLFVAAGGVFMPLVALALLALVASTEVWLIPHTGALRWPVRIYTLLIAAMAVAAAGLPATDALAGWGAASFVASDLVLAVQLFRLSPDSAAARGAGWLLWVLYIAGQALILLAFVPGIGLF